MFPTVWIEDEKGQNGLHTIAFTSIENANAQLTWTHCISKSQERGWGGAQWWSPCLVYEGLDYIDNTTKFKHIKARTKDFEWQTLQTTFMLTWIKHHTTGDTQWQSTSLVAKALCSFSKWQKFPHVWKCHMIRHKHALWIYVSVKISLMLSVST